MSRESRGDRDRGDGAGGLDDKVSTFGIDVADLGDAELERRTEAYLAEQERRYKEPAEEYLRRQERRYKAAAEAYLGFDRGELVDVDRQEVDRGDD